jgi:uncharacterized membrane protein HdeD (DUF308 family)
MSLSFATSPAGAPPDERASLRPDWWLFLALGLVSVIAGILAISSAVIATLASVFVFGWLLLIEATSEVIGAVMVHNWKGFVLHLVAAIVYLIVGLFMLGDPIRAAAVLTLLLATAFFAGGLLRIILSLVMRFPSWPWVLLNGVIDLLFGAFIWWGWPGSSLWVIGQLVGIDLLLHGWSSVVLALTVRKHNPVQSAPA